MEKKGYRSLGALKYQYAMRQKTEMAGKQRSCYPYPGLLHQMEKKFIKIK